MKTVYVVDDDELMLELLTRALQQHEYHVRAYRSPGDVVADLNDAEPDLVISDINMPGMDGFDLAEVVARRPRVVPVVLITAQPTDEQALRAQSSGIRRLVKKPVGNLSALVDLVREIVPPTPREELDALRREFFIGLSHELRTPMTALKLALDELEAEGTVPEQLVRIGQRNAQRIARYIDTELCLLELRAGGRPVVRSEVTLRDVLKDCVPCDLNGTGDRAVWTDPTKLRAVVRVLTASNVGGENTVSVTADMSGNGREVVLRFEKASFSANNGRMDSCAGEAPPAPPWNPSAGDEPYSFERACRRVVESVGGKLFVVDSAIHVSLPLSLDAPVGEAVE